MKKVIGMVFLAGLMMSTGCSSGNGDDPIAQVGKLFFDLVEVGTKGASNVYGSTHNGVVKHRMTYEMGQRKKWAEQPVRSYEFIDLKN